MAGEHLLEFSEGVFWLFLISLLHVALLEILFVLATPIISLSVVHVGIRHVIFVLVIIVSVEGVDVFDFIVSDWVFIASVLSVICLSIGGVRWVIKSIRIFFFTAISIHHIGIFQISFSFKFRLSICAFSLPCVCFRNILVSFILLLPALRLPLHKVSVDIVLHFFVGNHSFLSINISYKLILTPCFFVWP